MELFTPDEVAEIFGVSGRTVRKWVRDGRLEALRPGRNTIRITRGALVKLVGVPLD